MKLEWDFKELYDFADNLSNFGRLKPTFERIARDVSKALLKRMKGLTPVDEYDLINGWDGNKFLVTEVADGFEVLIVNKTDYALFVNDGHPSHNQFNKGGSPYEVKHRVQVRTPHKWQKGDGVHWVFGHFFVERGIIQLKATKEIESIIMRELEKWWEGCING